MSEDKLVVLNRAPQELVVAKRINALQRLFQVKPKHLELVSKSTHKEGAEPGTFRVTSTNEKFKEMRAVILFEPIEQREHYRKGEYTKDSKLCFSLDNLQPHPKAKNPPALYCETCPMGDINWAKYREARGKGIVGEALQAYIPPCRKYWHLFIAARDTQRPYYFNVKGSSVKNFEDAMSNMSDLFQLMIQSAKAEIRAANTYNANNPEGPQMPVPSLPASVADIIWHVSFTMYSFQKNGGQFMVGFKDFSVMKEEDRAEFGKILEDFIARRNAGQIQNQEAAEAEEEEALAAERPASEAEVRQATVAQKNAEIVI